MAGLRSNEVRIDAYDPAWPGRFAAEARRLRAALGAHVAAIEHIGSTSVPGMPAKPIIDIAVAVDSLAPLESLEQALAGCGYVAKGEFGLPGRQFFLREAPDVFHVHVVEKHSGHFSAWLRFRDALRADAAVRDAYAALKHGLAARFAGNRPAYTAAKGEFIRAVLARNPSS